MIRFDGYNIELTSGDTLFFNVNLAGRVLPEGSVAYFTVKENPKSEANVIRKKIDVIDGSIDIRLSSEDTYLPARTYYWDIRVLIPIDSGGYEVETPMEYAAFTIVDAIGFPGDDGQPPGLDENLPRLSLLIEEAREVIEELKDYQIPDEQIEQIVSDYLEENPPEAGVSMQEVEQTVSEAIADLPDWTKTENKPTYTASEVGALPESTKIPYKTSDLTNNSGFITKAVGDLTNYYLKSETYTQAEINQRISAIPKFAISVVSTLPTTGISETTIYLVKSGSGSDLYTEYIRVNGAWEVLGSQRVDLTGYATETWVVGQLAGYQPKGDYLTTADLSGAVEDALAQAKESGEFDGEDGAPGAVGSPGKDGSDGGYYSPVFEGTVLTGWEPSNDDMFSIDQNVDLKGEPGTDGTDGGYYTPQMNGTVLTGWKPSKDDMPEILQNIDLQGPAGKDGEDGYTPVKGIDYFDGKDGSAGNDGEDGVSVTHSWSGTTLTITSASGTSSANLKGEKGDTGNAGSAGKDGSDGKDGVSATHSWNGTTLTVTSASGTSSADLKGEKGNTGSTGATGQRGTGILKITTAPSSYTTATGGFTPTYRVALSTVTSQSKVSAVLVGDVIQYSYYQYPVGYVDSSYVYLGARTSIRGATGAAGAAGSDATVTSANIVSALGYTPANAETVSQLSEAIDAIGTQEEIVQQVIAALGTPVFGTVDADNNIVLTGDLAEGTYTIKYEDADGEQTTIGTLTTTAAPTYTNVLPLAIASDGTPYNGGQGWKTGTRLNSSGAESTSSATEIEVTGFIPVKNGDTIYLSGITMNNGTYASQTYMWLYDSSFTAMTGRYRLFSQYADDVMSSHQASGYIDMDASGNITKLTVQHNVFYTGSTQADLANTAYLRISCEKIDENSIITVNEPIV